MKNYKLTLILQTSKPSTPIPAPAQTDEEKKAERRAKFQAWKEKIAAERERKEKELAAAGGARSILDEIDKKAASAQKIATPETPTTPPTTTPAPAPDAGRKYDPKSVAKSAAAPSPEPSSILGKDISVPSIAASSTTSTLSIAGNKANKYSVSASPSSGKHLTPVHSSSSAFILTSGWTNSLTSTP